MRSERGQPYPLGATWDGAGVNFALFSEHASKVELCLFESEESRKESHRIPFSEKTDHVWHIYLPDIKPGCHYGYRVHGPFDPGRGLRFNPVKVLVDPYAKWIARAEDHDISLFGYRFGAPGGDLALSRRNNAAHAPLSVVIDPSFTWGDDRPPQTPWNETVIYETHVKGFTARHPLIPKNLRGTFAGLASEPAIQHLNNLGISAVELMPIHQHANERHLVEKKLTNYWGYNTLGYFAPATRFCSGTLGDPVREFKMMVRTLHEAGIEVLLDVVYNHTAEGNHLGPTLTFRGLDNPVYYKLNPDDPQHYEDFTGCGNTINIAHPRVLQLVMDSLRYWVNEMHVDGFRFDLAAALMRDGREVNPNSSFLKILQQDPVLSQVKLIAEPWDLGEGGYQVGNFPPQWSELNGRYRDTVRRFWKGDRGTMPDLASRLTGSSDLYKAGGRSTRAGINFITSHDGFTLQDLVSYNVKHNQANGERNRDGSDFNDSWNCGVEGPTSNAKIKALRARQKRNLMATLLLSQGVPMICGGDELGKTQKGNNNAYCHDNDLSWHHWRLDPEHKQFLEFTRSLIRFRKSHGAFARKKFFQGKKAKGSAWKDLAWLSPQGREMTQADWNDSTSRCIGALIGGSSMVKSRKDKKSAPDGPLLILLNAHHEKMPFTLPETPKNKRWKKFLDTFEKGFSEKPIETKTYQLRGLSLAAFLLEAQKK